MFGTGGLFSSAKPGGKSATFSVVNCPSQELARLNRVFLNEADYAALYPPTTQQPPLAKLKNNIYIIQPIRDVAPKSIAFNSIQRKELLIALGDQLELTTFDAKVQGIFPAVGVTFEVEPVAKNRDTMELEYNHLLTLAMKTLNGAVVSAGQSFVLDVYGSTVLLRVSNILELRSADQVQPSECAWIVPNGQTQLYFIKGRNAAVKIIGGDAAAGAQPRQIFKADFEFEKLGIGGLDKEFAQIFRRAFASRVYPPSVIQQLGISHVKGMLLYGPPGTGKTLIARQIGKMLNAKEPKVVNGPEILDKYVGGSEKNVRELFGDAEKDYAANGENSDLHIIIFDEIDAICKKRGTTRDSTGVQDTVVNQILSKIDGVNSLNNILVIGMTNRKDMIDDALLRPGRLEVHVEISLPDEHGRFQILSIHTSKMRENGMLGPSVDLADLAARTQNYSGAEIEGLCKAAAGFALNRNLDMKNLKSSAAALATDKSKKVIVDADDFDKALVEVQPAFGTGSERLERCLLGGFIMHGQRLSYLLKTGRMFIDEVRTSPRNPLLSVLIEGDIGSGKTAFAAKLALESHFPFVRFVSPEQYVGYGEASKCAALAQVFDDAHKSSMSVLVLDNLERMIEYTPIGPRFSNVVLQTLMVLIKTLPPFGRRLLILATTGSAAILDSLGLTSCFNAVLETTYLDDSEIQTILRGMAKTEVLDRGKLKETGVTVMNEQPFNPGKFASLAEQERIVQLLCSVGGMGIKKMLMLLEMAKTDESGILSYARFEEGIRAIR